MCFFLGTHCGGRRCALVYIWKAFLVRIFPVSFLCFFSPFSGGRKCEEGRKEGKERKGREGKGREGKERKEGMNRKERKGKERQGKARQGRAGRQEGKKEIKKERGK